MPIKMGCEGPEPPEASAQEMAAAATEDLSLGADSDEELPAAIGGYQLLGATPPAPHQPDDDDEDDDDEAMDEPQENLPAVPPIEPVELEVTREVWGAPRPCDPINMDSERAQQVMSAMANFSLPQTSIPEWAQSISEDQWKRTLHERIEKLKNK